MEKTYVTKDSGARQEFKTGSVRDQATGKGRYDLIPTEPLRRLAGLYERGAAKYGDRNWEKGQPLMRYIDSMMRHVNCLVAGEPEEDHAAAIAWNAFGYMQTLSAIEAGRLPAELDNRPAPEPQYDGCPGGAAAIPQKPTPETVVQVIVNAEDPDGFATRMAELLRAEADRRASDAQLEIPFDPEPVMTTDGPFTNAERDWFAIGERVGQSERENHVEELTRCNDPHCQMCPLVAPRADQHPLMRMARRGEGQ